MLYLEIIPVDIYLTERLIPKTNDSRE